MTVRWIANTYKTLKKIGVVDSKFLMNYSTSQMANHTVARITQQYIYKKHGEIPERDVILVDSAEFEE